MDAARRPSRQGRSRYVRFVVGDDGGVITTAGELVDLGRLDGYARDRLRMLFTWFNRALPIPPFRRSGWSERARCWFRAKAVWMLRRAWDIALILREHGRPVRVLHREAPGRVLYRDSYQVVAVPEASPPDRLRRTGWRAFRCKLREPEGHLEA